MLVINDLINLKLKKRHTGWCLTVPDKNWFVLRDMKKEELLQTNNTAENYFFNNLENTVGLQGTSIQSLKVSKEQVADWIRDDFKEVVKLQKDNVEFGFEKGERGQLLNDFLLVKSMYNEELYESIIEKDVTKTISILTKDYRDELLDGFIKYESVDLEWLNEKIVIQIDFALSDEGIVKEKAVKKNEYER